ncbi:MAG: porin [Candidatus Dadabacteria bacterium]|nr:MAG: porin [Candidatus Dadabacteria bacterium]
MNKRGLKRTAASVAAAALLVAVPLGRAAKAAGTDTGFHVYWKDGIRADTADKSFRLKIGGRIMNDWAFFGIDDQLKADVGPFDDGTEFRRARLYVAGEIYGSVIFKAQYDFAGGDADFKDMYIGLKGLPGHTTLKVGHFKEPFGLEELTSSKYITFLERSFAATFAPSRNTGLGLSGACMDERVTWAAGIFRDVGSFGDAKGDAYNVTARLTGLPLYADDGATLVHVGLAYSRKNPDDTVRFKAHPESHLAPTLVDTGSVLADSVDLLGAEAAVVLGPFSLQGEYAWAHIDTAPLPADLTAPGQAAALVGGTQNADLSGYYIQASYFLTGEHRHYKRSHGAFARVKPKENFLGKQGGGPGAIELAARWASIDLTDGPVAGGELDDITVGVNWYLNPNARVMANYVRADLDSSGEADIFQTRFQIDF